MDGPAPQISEPEPIDPTLADIFREVDAEVYALNLYKYGDEYRVAMRRTGTDDYVALHSTNLADTIKRAYKALQS